MLHRDMDIAKEPLQGVLAMDGVGLGKRLNEVNRMETRSDEARASTRASARRSEISATIVTNRDPQH